MRAYERFLDYVKIHTASSPDTESTPSTYRQFDLSRRLAREMRAMGMAEVYEDDYAYVYGTVPASPGMENKACVGFIAHIDTVPEFSGANVKPCLVEDYRGQELPLGDSGRVLSPEKFPHLLSLKGRTLITTDGTTVLGADDKAGVAEILTACERLLHSDIPHGRVVVCFTPDEEVGHGAALLDIDRLGADFAYTVDGGELWELNYETFNAAAAHWEVTGLSVHPGAAKDMMVNASLVAMEINSMLPAGEVPACTEGYEGFFHLTDMEGAVDKAELNYIIRDHSAALYEARVASMRHIEKLINAKYGPGTAELTIHEQYRNMAERLKHSMGIVELAKRAIRQAGLEPKLVPIRGGTDGAQLTYRGLLCPNIGTGGYCCHGPYEHICVEDMDLAVEIITNIVAQLGQR